MAEQDQDEQGKEALLVDDQLEGSESEEGERRNAGWAGWVISAAFHALMLLIMAGIYWAIKQPEQEVPPVRVATIEPPPKKEDKPKTERTLETKVELDVPNESDKPAPITQVDLPVEDSQREEDNDNPNPKGREEAVADSEMGGQGAFAAIGAGGGASGMFGNRSGGGRHRAVGKYGGSRGSESAVDAALRWFKKHQSPNGKWDTINYFKNCTEDPKCEPGGGADPQSADVAMTGYALLCFLGAGYDHCTPNKYKATVKKGLDWLLSIQQADGYLGLRNYENAVAAMALCEAFAMTGDPALKGPAQRSVDQILAHQNQFDAGEKDRDPGYGKGFGWDYKDIGPRNDSSVSGWNVMALKSALAAGLNVGNGMEGAKRWLDHVWKKVNPDWQKIDPYTGESRYPYCYQSDSDTVRIAPAPGPGQPAPNSLDLTCVGGVCAVFLGHHAGDPMLESLSNYIMNHEVPKRIPCNSYYMYYNTLTIFQCGGDKWKKWNGAVRDLLVNAQRKGDGCFDGSWDWGDGNFTGAAHGRVLTTAYCTLDLEVYYRYMQVGGGHDGPKR